MVRTALKRRFIPKQCAKYSLGQSTVNWGLVGHSTGQYGSHSLGYGSLIVFTHFMSLPINSLLSITSQAERKRKNKTIVVLPTGNVNCL